MDILTRPFTLPDPPAWDALIQAKVQQLKEPWLIQPPPEEHDRLAEKMRVFLDHFGLQVDHEVPEQRCEYEVWSSMLAGLHIEVGWVDPPEITWELLEALEDRDDLLERIAKLDYLFSNTGA